MDKAEAARVFTPAAREAVKAFPVDADHLELVAVSENATFRVAGGNGAYVLRLHRPGYHSFDELNSERIWTRALADAGISVPIPLTTREGGDYVSVPVPALGQQRQAGMTRWIEGELLSDVLEREPDVHALEHYFEQLGAIEAAMHNQSSAWRPPPGFTRHALDSDGLMGEAPHWGPFWEHRSLSAAERKLLRTARAHMHEKLSRLGREPAVYSLIHADMHPGNILVDGDRLTVIDFDDAGFGWHQYDIAVVLMYWQSKPNAAEIERAFLGGYSAVRPVPDEALASIPMFRLIRGMAAIGWLHQRPELKTPAGFEERKAWVLEQCAALRQA